MGASGVAGSHPRGNCARPRGAPAPQAVTPVAVRVPDANDASHGDRCHLNGRPHRVDAAARDLHQRSGALGASFLPGSDAGGPSSPWRQHVRVTRRRPPRRRQRPPARAAYRLRTQRRQWVASQADDAHTCAPCADRRHSYSTARSLTRRGASMGPESAGLWRRAPAAPPPRHAPTADGGDLDGRASRSSLAPAPNAAAPADDRHYPRRLHRGWPPRPERARARAGHSAHAATAVALGPHAPVMRRRRPAQRQRATTGLLSAEGHLQEKWPRRGPYEGARARKPNEVIRRPYPSSASKTGLGCGRDDDARSSYEAPGMIGQATTSSETPSITSVAGYGEMPKCGKLPGAPPVLTLKQRQLFIMIESSELRGSTTTLEVLWVVVPNDRISKVPGVPPDEAAGLYF